jgi:hypothetical protein
MLGDAFRAIGLALNASHNTVATDVVGVAPDEKSWRIDHSKEIALLDELVALVSTGICPECADRSKNRQTEHLGDH